MFFKKTWPALLWALFILSLCALPGSTIPDLKFLDWLKPDKIVHFVLFGVLSYLLIKGFLEQTSYPHFHDYAKAYSLILGSIYGVIIELLQEYVFTGRTGEIYDSVADSMGTFLGLWFFNYRAKRKSSKTVS